MKANTSSLMAGSGILGGLEYDPFEKRVVCSASMLGFIALRSLSRSWTEA